MKYMTFLHREIVDSIPGYKQGKPAVQQSNMTVYKLSSNENAFAPLESVRAAIIEEALPTINRYQNMRGVAVVERLAQFHGVNPDNIVLGCGSTEVITQLVQLVAGHGDEVVYPWRSFEAYPIIVDACDAVKRPIALRADGGHDIDAMIAAINDHTRLVIVNTPNNPTGVSLSNEEARRLMQAVPSNVLVLFDEAYVQFDTNPNRVDALALQSEYPNIVVARTFSKAYGLAGLRVGYGIAAPEVIEGMLKVSLPFGVTQMAQTAVLASLEAQEELESRVRHIIAERERVVAAVREQGWRIPDTESNFFWLALGEHTTDVAQIFQEHGLMVRAFAGEGIRITLGEDAANSRVIDVMEQLAPTWSAYTIS